jgi:hypothetical protein
MKLAGDFGFKTNAFHDGDQRSLGKALNEEHWRHGLTVSLGNGMSVSEENAKRRLRYIALQLKRRIWGNNHRKQRNIEFVVFKHQFINQYKKREEKETGSRDQSDRQQKDLADRQYQALRTSTGKQGRFGEHYHAVMAVEGNHGWSDQEVADAIYEIEADRTKEWRGEKRVHVDWNWKNGNAFHSYVGREVEAEFGRWEIEKQEKQRNWKDAKRHFGKQLIDKDSGESFFIMRV